MVGKRGRVPDRAFVGVGGVAIRISISVSVDGVAFFFRRLSDLEADLRWLGITASGRTTITYRQGRTSGAEEGEE